MKKIIQVIKKERILRDMCSAFLAVCVGAQCASPQTLNENVTHLYNSGWVMWLSVLARPVIVSFLLGIIMTIWKMNFPSKKYY